MHAAVPAAGSAAVPAAGSTNNSIGSCSEDTLPILLGNTT